VPESHAIRKTFFHKRLIAKTIAAINGDALPARYILHPAPPHGNTKMLGQYQIQGKNSACNGGPNVISLQSAPTAPMENHPSETRISHDLYFMPAHVPCTAR
jgi:hypothetical protein